MSYMKLVVLFSLTFLLTACGEKATPDPAAISAAIQATLTAIPQPPPEVVEVTREAESEVTLEVVREVTKVVVVTATPTNTPRPTPTPQLSTLIPSRQAYSHSYEITEEFDRFEWVTVVSLDADVAEAVSKPQGSLTVFYFYAETTPTPPDLVFFALVSTNDGWEFLRCHSLRLLLDGRSLPMETTHYGEVILGSVVERVSSWLTLEDFLSIVNADKVEGRVCNTEFELTPAQMEALRDLASRMQP